MYTIETVCPFCGKSHTVEVRAADWHDYEDGALAQDAFPYLSASERELIISGICPTCWNSIFAEEEDFGDE